MRDYIRVNQIVDLKTEKGFCFFKDFANGKSFYFKDQKEHANLLFEIIIRPEQLNKNYFLVVDISDEYYYKRGDLAQAVKVLGIFNDPQLLTNIASGSFKNPVKCSVEPSLPPLPSEFSINQSNYRDWKVFHDGNTHVFVIWIYGDQSLCVFSVEKLGKCESVVQVLNSLKDRLTCSKHEIILEPLSTKPYFKFVRTILDFT